MWPTRRLTSGTDQPRLRNQAGFFFAGSGPAESSKAATAGSLYTVTDGRQARALVFATLDQGARELLRTLATWTDTRHPQAGGEPRQTSPRKGGGAE